MFFSFRQGLRLKPLLLATSLVAVGFTSMAASAEADTTTAVPSQVTQAIKSQLGKMIDNVNQAQITPTPLKNLYQVTLGPMVVYMSGDGQYLITGKIIDLKNRVDLTAQAKEKAVKEALAKVPERSMIIYPAKGEQKHVITVFTDIDCPYCHKLHKEIPKLNAAGVTVRYLSYPRAGIGSNSYQKAVSVWCAADRGKAMDQAIQGKITPKNCENTVANQYQLAQTFEVTGTPTIILDNGRVIPGYVPAEKLIQVLNQGKK